VNVNIECGGTAEFYGYAIRKILLPFDRGKRFNVELRGIVVALVRETP
jgi:hypothetical protein